MAHYMNACMTRSIYTWRLCFSSAHFYCQLTKQIEKRDSHGHREKTLPKVSIRTDMLLQHGKMLNVSRGHAQMVHSR